MNPMALTEELTNLLDTEIAVIMNDGQAYRGKLTKFDSETMVLKEVYETTNQEIDWVETEEGPGKVKMIRGYVPWRRVTLPKLILRIPLVLRIWPWTPQDISAEELQPKPATKRK
jgi:small nuclear ribonucleoprotein (snRNP)-like protein